MTPQEISPLRAEVEKLTVSATQAVRHPMLPKAAAESVMGLVRIVGALVSEMEALKAATKAPPCVGTCFPPIDPGRVGYGSGVKVG